MNASPAMDTGGPLVCFDATVTLRSANGERTIGLDALWTGPGKTSAAPDELLVAIDLPAPAGGTGSCYVRLEYRRQMEIAVVGATAMVVLDGDVTDARIAITALTPTIRRVPEAEAALVGTAADAGAVRAAARAAAAAATPISDVRGSAEYRRAMAEVMAARAIAAALTRARGGSVSIPASPALYGAKESR
jgi:CO/xanthine dehydrogenase FAD-binding subunit